VGEIEKGRVVHGGYPENNLREMISGNCPTGTVQMERSGKWLGIIRANFSGLQGTV